MDPAVLAGALTVAGVFVWIARLSGTLRAQPVHTMGSFAKILASVALATAMVSTSAGIGCSGRDSPPTARPDVRESELALRSKRVGLLHDAYQGAEQTRRVELGRELVDELIALASFHRAAAVEIDPRAASLPPPRDLRGDGNPQGDGTEVDAEAPPEPAELPRDDASFAALSEPARAHVRAADQATVEAITVLTDISWLAERAGTDPRPIHGRRAQLLMDLGQQVAAREAWMFVVRDDRVDALTAMGYLVFAEWYAQRNQSAEASALLTKAAAAAAAANENGLLRRICELGREWAVQLPSCTR